jgi:hypothetical protein
MNRVITPGDELEAQPAKQLAVAAATQSIYTHWIGQCKLTQRKRRSWLGRDTHTATQMHLARSYDPVSMAAPEKKLVVELWYISIS